MPRGNGRRPRRGRGARAVPKKFPAQRASSWADRDDLRRGLAADTEAEARRLSMTREYWRIGFEQGLRNPLVSPEQAAAHSYTDAERARIDELLAVAFGLGTRGPATVWRVPVFTLPVLRFGSSVRAIQARLPSVYAAGCLPIRR